MLAGFALSLLFLNSCASSVRYSAAFHKSKRQNVKKSQQLELSEQQSKLLTIAQGYVGVPYCYGGQGPDCFDCSGFVGRVFEQCGTSLPRSAADMSKSSVIRRKNIEDAAPGDLIFFDTEHFGYATHVGIVVDSTTMIHSSTQKGIRYEDYRKGIFIASYLYCGSLLN